MRPLLLVAAVLTLALGSVAAQDSDDDADARAGTTGDDAAGVDWSDCLACHTDVVTQLPTLSTFRIDVPGTPLPDCRDCHQPVELSALRTQWTHPVRAVADHLACMDCHVVATHDGTCPPPRPVGDYNASGCHECHPAVELRLSMLWSHGHDPRVTCRDCHPAHRPLAAALPPRLLPHEFRQNWLGHGDWWASNEACFACHTPGELLLPLDRGFVTLNTVNYHDTHVVGGQVLCIECHDPHGSNRRGMLRDYLLSGEYLAQVEHIDGASCAVLCHEVDHQNWRYINSVY